jgi:predicted nuclease with TOPRIM domain
MPELEPKLRQRLEALQAEYTKGQQTLQQLESQIASVRATLLRISGAVQVLQEALGDEAESPPPQWPTS